MTLHLEKSGLRGLAIAESFQKNSDKSVLAGVVMRRDLKIDGFVIGKSTIRGNDATVQIINMFEKLGRADINYLLISGIIISLYNIIDIKKIFDAIKIPVIGITYQDSAGIEDAIKKHFTSSESVIKEYANLPKREKIMLHTKKSLYIRREGCSKFEAAQLLDSITLQGSIPEPIRIAKLLAHSILAFRC